MEVEEGRNGIPRPEAAVHLEEERRSVLVDMNFGSGDARSPGVGPFCFDGGRGLGDKHGMTLRFKMAIGGAVVVLAGGGWWWGHRDEGSAAMYLTAPVKRGELVEHVHASGMIKPLRLVEVGTQVSGPVKELMADFNDTVTAGQVVAQIDPEPYAAGVQQAEASVIQSEASVVEARARLKQAEATLTRANELFNRKLIPQSELDGAVADRDVLAAQLQMSAARLVQSRAALRQSQSSLEYTTIRSPVDGVVIERKVDQGQTVVASMSAQTIFVIAADLHTVLVEANIPEADIGRLKEGQPVTFTVDAYEQTFTGVVHQVRLSGTSVQNVVTYPVIIHAINTDDKLLPGMTANIACEVARRDNVIKVPNASLRFRPDRPARKKTGEEDVAALAVLVTGPQVWVLAEKTGKPEAVAVKVGINDGAFTEITEAAALSEGQEIVTSFAPGAKRPEEKVNPFAPSFPPRGIRRGMR